MTSPYPTRENSNCCTHNDHNKIIKFFGQKKTKWPIGQNDDPLKNPININIR